MRTAIQINPTPEEFDRLQAIVSDADSPEWLVARARAILMAADGEQNKQIAAQLGVIEQTVARWRRRFAENGLDGITSDAPRSGRPPEVTERVEEEVVRLGKNNYRGRSIRSISRKVGASLDTTRRILKKHGIAPYDTGEAGTSECAETVLAGAG